jgi:ankyrin repeat protein
MFFAVREGHIDVMFTLLEAGADVHELLQRVKDGPDRAVNNASYRPVDDGISPLLMAVRNGHFELAVALVNAGADPNDQHSGFTPLHTMSWVRKPDESDRGDPAPIGSGNLTSLEFVRALVAMGADVNLRLEEGAPRQPNSASRLKSGGATPFLLAADRADAALMHLLLELGADPFIPNLNHTTPLMAAAGLGTAAPEEEAGTEPEALIATRLLLDLGADINAVNDACDTAMHGAAYGSFPTVVQLLADHGADIDIWNQKNEQGRTPLFIAEGHRGGLPRLSRATIEAITVLMDGAGVSTAGERPPIVDQYAPKPAEPPKTPQKP